MMCAVSISNPRRGIGGESTRLASDGSEYLTDYGESLALDFPRRCRSAVESCSAHWLGWWCASHPALRESPKRVQSKLVSKELSQIQQFGCKLNF